MATRYKEAGARVCVVPHKSAPGKGLTYGAFCGKLLEGARVGPEAGWDVVDVATTGGREQSVYGFSLRKSARRRKKR